MNKPAAAAAGCARRPPSGAASVGSAHRTFHPAPRHSYLTPLHLPTSSSSPAPRPARGSGAPRAPSQLRVVEDPLTSAFGFLMKPEGATIFSAVVAVASVVLSLFGSFIADRRKIQMQREIERDRLMLDKQNELRSTLARFRGPLLEATADLEQRLYQLLTLTPTCTFGEEEAIYTLFTLAQFLGFVEVVRREGPRERFFLHSSQTQSQGTDTQAAMIEGLRFVMEASSTQLEEWYASGESREHPGTRTRLDPRSRTLGPALDAAAAAAAAAAGPAAAAAGAGGSVPVQEGGGQASRGGGDGHLNGSSSDGALGTGGTAGSSTSLGHAMGSGPPGPSPAAPSPAALRPAGPSGSGVGAGAGAPPDQQVSYGLDDTFRLSRGMQRAIGAMINITANGATRHYTMSYSDFFRRFRTDAYFHDWLRTWFEDIIQLEQSGAKWQGQAPFPFNRWTRLLLLQQLLIDNIELLDPGCVRVPQSRRMRLSPVTYGPLPNLEQYMDRTTRLEMFLEMDTGSGSPPSDPTPPAPTGGTQLFPDPPKALALLGDAAAAAGAVPEAPGPSQPSPPRGPLDLRQTQGAAAAAAAARPPADSGWR